MRTTIQITLSRFAAALAAATVACGSAAPAGSSATAARPARVMTYNIHHAAGNDACTTPPSAPGAAPTADCSLDLERIAAIVRDAGVDVAGLQEVDRFWGRSGMIDQSARLGALLGMQTCYGANLSHPADAHSDAPHEYGTLILSRHPIVTCENTLLPRAHAMSEQRGLLLARVRIGGAMLRFYNTHLHTREEDRRLQVDAIVERIAGAPEPVMLVGDLNARPAEPYLAPLFGGLNDAWAAAGTGPGFTSPARPGEPASSRIDYLLVSRAVTVTGVATLDAAAMAAASDHYPVAADVVLPPAAGGLSGRQFHD